MGYEAKKFPKGVAKADMSGEKRVKASKVDREEYHEGASGEKMPKGVLSSDTSGERKAPIAGGVGMGKADGLGLREGSHMGHHDGRLGECKGHMGEKSVYDHKRVAHDQDSM
jgi:hypothetical protein